MQTLFIYTSSDLTDENAVAFDDNNNNSTSLVKPEPTMPDFSQDMIKVNPHGIM